LKTGLFDSFRSIVQYSRHGEDAPKEVLETIRSLYWECVMRLDERISRALEFLPEEATVVIVADHGEELYHGYIGHARLYDECVRVPLFVKNAPRCMDEQLVRQLDIAPSLLDWLDIPRPDDWEGKPHADGGDEPAYMFNHSPSFECTFTGIRTGEHKLIKRLDSEGLATEGETYDLAEDPAERNSLSDCPASEELENQLDQFLQQGSMTRESSVHKTGMNEETERRLQELGYL
jgi:arylsulfatase A-like enzyme